MPYTPPQWGPASTTRDYRFFMAGTDANDPLISLLGHALTSPSQDLSDPVTVPEERLVGGRRVVYQRTVRPAQQQGLTYTLLFPSSLWTPALERARRMNGCETDFYALRTCIDTTGEYDHAYIYPRAILDPPVEVGDFITLEDETAISEQTTLRVTNRDILWSLKAQVVYDDADALYSAAFTSPSCEGCSEDVYVEAFAGGGNGTDAAVTLTTDDRFASQTAQSTDVPVGSVVTSTFSEGDVVLRGFADTGLVSTAATGGTTMSVDGGVTDTIDTGITEPIWGVAFAFGQYVAVGGTAAGAAVVYYSDNGIDWTASTSTALPVGDAATAIDVDTETGNFFITTQGGNLLKGTFTGGGILLTDISANLPSAPTDLFAVAVLGRDHIVVGGTSAFAAESFDGGATFTTLSVPGTATIRAMAGSRYRLLVGIGTKIQERSIITENVFQELVIADGVTVTGDVTDIAMPPQRNYNAQNYFIITTDDGEVIFARPKYPGA